MGWTVQRKKGRRSCAVAPLLAAQAFGTSRQFSAHQLTSKPGVRRSSAPCFAYGVLRQRRRRFAFAITLNMASEMLYSPMIKNVASELHTSFMLVLFGRIVR